MINWKLEAILGSLVSFMVTEGIPPPFPLFGVLYNECSGAAAFFPLFFFFLFLYFSLEAGEGEDRQREQHLVDDKL